MADWVSIKAEYVAGGISTRAIAEKYDVSYNTLRKHAEKEGWASDRKKHGRKVAAKVSQKVATTVAIREADRLTRLLSISDTLSDKLEEAAAQLDRKMVTQKRKVKTTQKPKDGAWTETTEETEIIDVIDAPIDRQGLKLLASALKDLRDVANTPRADQQSLEKIAALMTGLDAEAKEGTPDGAAE